MAQDKRIFWQKVDNKIIYAWNQKREKLGYLEYERVGQFIHWCWYQFNGVRMSPGCLQEVRDKQKEMAKQR